MQTSKKQERDTEFCGSTGCEVDSEAAEGLGIKNIQHAAVDNDLQEVRSAHNVASGDAIDILAVTGTTEDEHTVTACALKSSVPMRNLPQGEAIMHEKTDKSLETNDSQETFEDAFEELEYSPCVSQNPVEGSSTAQGSVAHATEVHFDKPRAEGSTHKCEEYRFPNFPHVPNIQNTLAELAARNEAHERDSRATMPENCKGSYPKGTDACRKHAAFVPDDYDHQYQRVLSTRLQQQTKPREPGLCGSCSRSMMGYVSAIQNLLQSLTIDIVVKGDDPPACSWCARDRINHQNRCHSDTEFSSVLSPYLDSELPASRVGSVLEHDSSPQGTQDRRAYFESPAGQSLNNSSRKSPGVTHRPIRVFGNPDRDILDAQRPQSHNVNYLTSGSHAAQCGQVPRQENAPPAEERNQKQGETSPQSFPCNVVTRNAEHLVSQRQNSSLAGQNAPTEVHCTIEGASAVFCDENGNKHTNNNALQPSSAPMQNQTCSQEQFSGFSQQNGSHSQELSSERSIDLMVRAMGPASSYVTKCTDGARHCDNEKEMGHIHETSHKQHMQHSYSSKRTQSVADQMLDLVQEHLLEPSQPIVKSQAYVTMAGNDLTAMLCLVLGNSLRVTGTTRTLVVLVTDGVSPALRHLLSSVFNLVQSVRSLGTQGTTKLTLLEQPDIGVSFTKLHAWRLTQFSKCVFLDAATMMVQCCDELFEREELSAVPDIGWPDCFNSGVFVYVPCMETFWDLVSFAERQGSFDGGDQGLLNMYFRNWSSDINRRLPFIYNLMANVSYTYKPAFKQFGKNVKIVQFFGGYKPWNVKFHAPTGQMSPAAGVHPTFAQFVQFWLHIYARRVLPMFSQPLQEKARDSQYICALDLLQHFPSFLTSEPVVTLPTPSFRSHPKPIIYLPPSPRMPPEIVEAAQSIEANAKPEVHASSVSSVSEPSSEESGPSVPTDTGTEETFAEEVDMKQTRAEQATSVKQHAFVEDLSGMLAWEQGRADYMGEHRSDNIIARLDQLIKHSSTEQCVMIKD